MNGITKPDPELCDEENPALTAEDIRKAVPAKEFFGEERLKRLVGGRPRINEEARKKVTTIRLDPDVLEAYKAEGKGWQTRINETLRAHMPGRK
jgi:uncharacterized protein (DUF4415 family)